MYEFLSSFAIVYQTLLSWPLFFYCLLLHKFNRSLLATLLLHIVTCRVLPRSVTLKYSLKLLPNSVILGLYVGVLHRSVTVLPGLLPKGVTLES